MARTKKRRAGRPEAIKAVARKQPNSLSTFLAAQTDQPIIDTRGLLDQADKHIISCDLGQAASLCRQVLKSDERDTRALETLALIELESSEIKTARKLFQKCVQYSKPTALPAVHLYLAQLSDTPEQSLKHFETALTTLQDKLEIIQSNSAAITRPESSSKETPWTAEEAEIRRSCSRALVGMTEIYLTDLCFDQSAEQKCLEYLATASALDPTDPEPLQALASVRLSQSEVAAAKEALLLAWSLWRDKSGLTEDDVKMEKSTTDEGEQVLVEDDEDTLPPFDARMQWAKLAMECDMWSEAIEVLQQCEAEDDEDGEVQYLLAVAWHLMGQSRDPEKYDAQTPESRAHVTIGEGLGRMECWMEAKECLETCLQLQERLGDASGLDTSILDHIKELSTALQTAGICIQSAHIEKDVVGHPDMDDEGAWEDASDVSMGIH